MMLESIFKHIENVHKIFFNENAHSKTYRYELIFAKQKYDSRKKDYSYIKILLVDTSKWQNLRFF